MQIALNLCMVLAFSASLVIVGGTGLVLSRVAKRYLRGSDFKTKVSFLGVICVSVLVGVGGGLHLSYNIGDRIKAQGIPIPLLVFVREEEHWTDFVQPNWLCIISGISNCLCPVGAASLIWLVAANAARRRP
jgi:hypothetical protein